MLQTVSAKRQSREGDLLSNYPNASKLLNFKHAMSLRRCPTRTEAAGACG